MSLEPVQHQQELHLRDYLRLIRKRYRLILGCVGTVAAVAAAYSLLTPNVYQSKATVKVEGQTGYVIRATPSQDEGGNLTPTTLSELIRSQSYDELARGTLLLTEGYNIDLTARRSQDEMVSLFEEDLMKKGLPAYFGRLVLKNSRGPQGKINGIGVSLVGEVQDAESSGREDGNSLVRRLSSVEKDEVIKQAGALAALARRFHINLFNLSEDQVGPKAAEIMNSSLIRDLPSKPLRGQRWENLPALERGAVVQVAYRELAKKKPDAADKRAKKEKFSSREIKDTGMLDLTFDSLDKYRATDGVDAMVCTVIWKNQYARKEAAQRIRQVTEYALMGGDGRGGVLAQLNRVNREIRNFKNSHHIPDIDAAKSGRSSQVSRLLADYQNTDASIAGLRQQVQNLSAELARIPRTVTSPTESENPTLGRITTELVSAKGELQSLQALYTDEEPRVQAQLNKISRLQHELEAEQAKQPKSAEVNQTPNPLYGEFYQMYSKARTELIGLQQRKRKMEPLLRQAQAVLSQVPNTEYEASGIVGSQTTLTSIATVLNARYLEAQLNEATKTPGARVVDLALEPGKKVKPKRTTNVILGVMLGFLLGLGASVLAESMDTRLRTREEVERALAGVPVLTAIPTFTADHPLVVHEQMRSPVTEAFRRLRSAIRFLGVERPLRTLVVTSPGFGEGKSTVAANLAASFAQSGHSVILVDGDLRKPVQLEIMGVDNRTGLTTLLLGDDSLATLLKPTEVDGLRVLPSGPVPPNPTELLDSAAMRALMDELGEHADVVIFDSSPASIVTDASILGSLADGVLLVAGGGITSRDSLADAGESLKQARARTLGVVLNRADMSDEDGGYHLYERYSANGSGANGHKKSERRSKVKV
jgi:capsular exopolysaccharide synthesis family protein